MCVSTELVLRLNVRYIGTLVVRLLRHDRLVRFIRKLTSIFNSSVSLVSLFLQLFLYCFDLFT